MSLKRDVSLKDALRYKGQGPMLTYILHRIGGIAMVLFVSFHVAGGYLMNQTWGATTGVFINKIYENWVFQFVFFFFIIFHLINGLRITILDLWPKLIEHQREAIWLEWAVFLPIYAIAAYVILNTGLGLGG